MSGLFAFLFLAAVVGIFKPYIRPLTRKHFAIAAVILFFMIGVTAPKSKLASTSEPAKTASPKPVDSAATPVAAKSAEPAGDWQYSTDRDEMRNTSARYAMVSSENEVDLDFPYGKVRGKLTVRDRPEDGLNIIFEVEKGQILCHAYGDDFVSAKFDDRPIKRFPCTGASDGSSEMAFLSREGDFLKSLRQSKRVIIEAEFFQQGRQQFIFNTAGLNWGK